MTLPLKRMWLWLSNPAQNVFRNVLSWTGLISAGFFSHVTYINNGFTWLDHSDIQSGVARLPLSQILEAFTHQFGQTGFYRPIVTVFHSLDFALYGQNATGYHFTNVVLHIILVVVAVYFMRIFFGLSERESFFGALIVAISPLSWLVVGSISYRGDLLLVIFTMLSMLFYYRARVTYRWWHHTLFFVFTLAALFSKETAFFWIPALILCLEISLLRRNDAFFEPHKKRWNVFILISGFVVAVAYFALRTYALPHIWQVGALKLSLSEGIGTRLWALCRELMYLVSPFTPSLSDATPITSLFSVVPFIVILLIGFFVFIVVKKGVGSPISRALLFLGIALAPALNVLPLPRFMSPHYVHFAGIGFAVLVVILVRVLKKDKSPLLNTFLLCICIWCVVMFVSTLRGGYRFKNDVDLFIPETSKTEHFSEGHYYLGTYFFEKGDTGLAYDEYTKALPDTQYIAFINQAGLYINLARVETEKKMYEAADAHLRIAAQLVPSFTKLIVYNRAVVASRKGDYMSVVSLLAPYRGKWPSNDPDVLLSEGLMKLGRQDEALDILKTIFPAFGPEEGAELIKRFGKIAN